MLRCNDNYKKMAQWSCTVQFLGGKWATVKVPSTTPLLKVLVQAANKFGYNPADYILKHGRVTVDLSTPVLYSNLPNRAKLEAVKKEESGHPTALAGAVLVALQLPDGQRVLHEHPPKTSLWDVILKAFPRVSDLPEDSVAVQYTRQRVEGRERLVTTSLLDLGLTQGKAALRLMIQLPTSTGPTDSRPSSSGVSTPVGVAKEGPSEQIEEKAPSSDLPSVAPQQKEQLDEVEGRQLSTEPMDTSEGSTGVSSEKEKQEEGEEGCVRAGEGESDAKAGGGSGGGGDVMSEQVKKVESDSHQVVPASSGGGGQPGRVFVTYHISSLPETSKEEPTDDFYRVTIDDVLVMQRDLKAKTASFDAPLETRVMRQLSGGAAHMAERYSKAVIRAQFPDGWVLQGLFEPSETLRSVVLFIRAHLADSALRFHLYTSPPKTVLRGAKLSLLQAGLVPATVVYVGLEDPSTTGPFLSEASMRSTDLGTRESIEEMRKVAGPVQTPQLQSSSQQKKAASGPIAPQHQPHVSMEATPGGSQRSEAGPSGSGNTSTTHPPTKIPKWLKLGPGTK